eukprot:CAMPEP_0204347566 /NCGR_PEP_ID=MMETSP0469-20131031/28052_1 /ASSEMBLY_ACC=CAM_ASM_000384 /TAXON_ID=2969 /ORGANISM="Oxyrrhis marina" /LENGTH=133 /DNA_ID=CAMNT_0051333395 /DNA_START=29 /DNA_END=427 /DNA_ORIENTATION=+
MAADGDDVDDAAVGKEIGENLAAAMADIDPNEVAGKSPATLAVLRELLEVLDSDEWKDAGENERFVDVEWINKMVGEVWHLVQEATKKVINEDVLPKVRKAIARNSALIKGLHMANFDANQIALERFQLGDHA